MAHVLIVDDEPSIREMLTLLLSGRGYDISTAADGKEGLAHLRSQHFDVLLCDIRMPALDGMSLAHIMVEEQPDLAIIMMTAFATLESVREATQIKVFDYLAKPIDIQKVMDTIDRALAARAPAKHAEKQTGHDSPDTLQAPDSHKTIDVFMIEDNVDDIARITVWLSNEDRIALRKSVGSTLANGLALIKARPPDLILLALQLPDSSGIDTLRRLRQAHDNIPVIVLVGQNDNDAGSQAVRAGAEDALWKSCLSPLLIAHSIRHSIERHHIRMRFAAQEALMRKILDTVVYGVALVGMDGDVYYCNPAAATILGTNAKRAVKELFGSPPQPEDVKDFSIGKGAEATRVQLRVVEMEWREKPAYLLCMRPLDG